MGVAPHVLVVSTKLDVATDAVVQELHELGTRVSRINTEELPFESTMTLKLGCEGTSLLRSVHGTSSAISSDLDSVTSCFYRRVRTPMQPPDMDSGVFHFCLRESRAALLGALLERPVPFMNDPRHVWAAEIKPYQLAVAKEAGLTIPRTVVSNEPAEIRAAFQSFHGRMIAKPVRSGYVEVAGTPKAIFTNRTTADDLADDAALSMSPAIYQEWIPKRYDLRVTVVGEQLFVAAIHSQDDLEAQVDWRHTADPTLRHTEVQLPDAITQGLQRLMRRLGLVFGAIDLIRTPDDEYLFLEVNPGGQWLWLENQLAFPIAATVAKWLTEPAVGRSLSR